MDSYSCKYSCYKFVRRKEEFTRRGQKQAIGRGFLRITFYSILLGYYLMLPKVSFAGVDLPWSTTFNCADWTAPNSLSCDGLVKYGDWYCTTDSPGKYEQVTSSANNPNGGGGKGQRHWIGDSRENGSGGTQVSFNSPQPEIWIRWYERFQNGFHWASQSTWGMKHLYWYDSANSGFLYLYMPGFNAPANVWGIYDQTGDKKTSYTSGGGWTDLYPSGNADGSWHCIEMHIKKESGAGNSDGQWHFWVDGVQKAAVTNLNFGMASRSANISRITIGSNAGPGGNGACAYVDYDDISISNTGRIGYFNGTQPIALVLPALAPPTGLRIIP